MALDYERLKDYVAVAAGKLADIEKKGFTDPGATASAILRLHYKDGFWDKKFAHQQFPPQLMGALKESEILPGNTGATTSTRGKIDSYLIQYLAPVGAFGNNSMFLRIAINSFGIDPGINVRAVNRAYPDGLWSSFWYSIGGNVLTDTVYGTADADEYRAGLLGMAAARIYLEHSKAIAPLSQIMLFAAENLELVQGKNYWNSPDYEVAVKNIKPKFGHILIREATRRVGFFQNNALIPVERAYLT